MQGFGSRDSGPYLFYNKTNSVVKYNILQEKDSGFRRFFLEIQPHYLQKKSYICSTMTTSTHPKDYSLLEAIQKGNNAAFDTLFHRYYQVLCNYGNRFVDLEDAEEIVQDSLLWIWENREILIVNVSVSSFLFTMVYRRALNRIKHNQRTLRVLTQLHEDMQEVLHDVDFYQIQELMSKIDEAVTALPDTYRETFIMHRFQRMSYKKIAETLGVSNQTVAYRIQQALKLLRLDLKDFLFLLLLFYLRK